MCEKVVERFKVLSEVEGRVNLYMVLVHASASTCERAIWSHLGQVYQRRSFRHIFRLCAWPDSPLSHMVEITKQLLLLCGS
jgi:hypothetical protein